jgi:cell division protease FtsH
MVYGDVLVGTEDSLVQATEIARLMVTKWGMSERLGPVSYNGWPYTHLPAGKLIIEGAPCSERTLEVIDDEVATIVREASQRARDFLSENRQHLDRFAEALVAREILEEKEITRLLEPAIGSSALGDSAGNDAVAPIRWGGGRT